MYTYVVRMPDVSSNMCLFLTASLYLVDEVNHGDRPVKGDFPVGPAKKTPPNPAFISCCRCPGGSSQSDINTLPVNFVLCPGLVLLSWGGTFGGVKQN